MTPIASDGRSIRAGWRRTPNAFSAENDPSASAPARSGNCPNTMLTAMPVRNPVITECDTNRVYRPSRRSAATIMMAPASSVSRISAEDLSASGTSASAEPAASADALVVVITMSLVLVCMPPNTGPTRLAYRPWIGLTPASTPDAMPSGTLAMAPGSPATRSAFR